MNYKVMFSNIMKQHNLLAPVRQSVASLFAYPGVVISILAPYFRGNWSYVSFHWFKKSFVSYKWKYVQWILVKLLV